MIYKNLEEMIRQSSHGRAYFYTLPTDIQKELRMVGDYIHSAPELHAHARYAESVRRDAIMSRHDG